MRCEQWTEAYIDKNYMSYSLQDHHQDTFRVQTCLRTIARPLDCTLWALAAKGQNLIRRERERRVYSGEPEPLSLAYWKMGAKHKTGIVPTYLVWSEKHGLFLTDVEHEWDALLERLRQRKLS